MDELKNQVISYLKTKGCDEDTISLCEEIFNSYEEDGAKAVRIKIDEKIKHIRLTVDKGIKAIKEVTPEHKGKKRKDKGKKRIETPETIIDDIFVIYHGGALMLHQTRRKKPGIDDGVLSGMITAVGNFIGDCFKGEGRLNQFKYGVHEIQIEYGSYLALACIIIGTDLEGVRFQARECIKEIESEGELLIKDWNGDTQTTEKLLNTCVEKLKNGGYVSSPAR